MGKTPLMVQGLLQQLRVKLQQGHHVQGPTVLVDKTGVLQQGLDNGFAVLINTGHVFFYLRFNIRILVGNTDSKGDFVHGALDGLGRTDEACPQGRTDQVILHCDGLFGCCYSSFSI